MKLGFYTNYSPNIVNFAESVGFSSIQLSAWPKSSLNPDRMAPGEAKEIARITQDEHGLEISALGYYPNHLVLDREEREETTRYFNRVLELAAEMEVPVVSTHAGQVPGSTVEQSFQPFVDQFTPYVDRAKQLGVKIAVENCPMVDNKTHATQNIAFSPEVWRRMFEVFPADTLGLEMDPSHLVYLGIDPYQATRDFGHRTFHVHAKDTDVDERAKTEYGYYGRAFGEIEGFGNGWWRFRAPGWGVINWADIFSALLDSGYTGNIDIEHEDEVFAKFALDAIEGESDIVAMFSREPNAVVLGYRHLSPLVPLNSTELLPE